jgi:hypothetical protein
MKLINFAFICEMELYLTMGLEIKFQDGFDCESFLDLNGTFLFFFVQKVSVLVP